MNKSPRYFKPCKKNHPANKVLGFTLIEIILYLAIVTTFLVSLMVVSQNLILGQAKSQTLLAVENNAWLALTRLGYEIRKSPTVNSDSQFYPANPGWLHLDNQVGASDDVYFFAADGLLYLQIGAGSPQALTSSRIEVKALTFQDVSAARDRQAIKIDLSLSYKNPSHSAAWRADLNRSITVTLRQ